MDYFIAKETGKKQGVTACILYYYCFARRISVQSKREKLTVITSLVMPEDRQYIKKCSR